MAHAREGVEEMTQLASALVINSGLYAPDAETLDGRAKISRA